MQVRERFMEAAARGVRAVAGGTGRGAVGTVILKVVATGVGFLTALVLARAIGAEGYGVYAYVFAWVGLLAIPAVFGLNDLLVRELSAHRARESWSLATGVVRWTNRVVIGTSLATAAIAVGLFANAGGEDARTRLALILGLASLPLMALSSLRQSGLRGLGRVVAGQVPELLVRPLLTLVLILAAHTALGDRFNGVWAVGAGVVSIAIAYGVGAWLLGRALPREVRVVPPEYRTGPWLQSALPFLFTSGMFVVNSRADVVLLGLLDDEVAVGIYSAAAKLASLVGFVLYGVNTALAPKIAAQFTRGDGAEELKDLVHRSTFWTTAATLPLAVGLIVVGPWLLAMFGVEFVAGYTALWILAAGQLANAATGSVGQLLNMTGHERDTAWAVAISALLNVILNLILIPRIGLAGAAIATAISTIVWNVILAIMVYRRFRFYSIFGLYMLESR